MGIICIRRSLPLDSYKLGDGGAEVGWSTKIFIYNKKEVMEF